MKLNQETVMKQRPPFARESDGGALPPWPSAWVAGRVNMLETHPLAAEIARLNATERRVIERFIHRQRVPPDSTQTQLSLGDRVADRVTAFGGSWTFIALTIAAIAVWMLINAVMAKAFDAYPYILLNLVLACLTVLQAPLIMMSQNR
ncbi:MAG TPA: DUF1003 domain-containing protein, partial [Vicinamibacterales bacterium]|nr:DUF1003 domain-containing protein [Vicinamibacterales bacterium]